MKALVLSGGGSKGLAHIGVIKAIEEKKLKFDFIVGTSMGSIVGALYALGYNSHNLKAIAGIFISKDLLKFKFSLNEFFDSKKVEVILDDIFANKTFKDAKIPLYITAFDLLTYHHIVFNDGYLKYAIRASISLPLVFRPVMINGRVLVDGGMFETVPLSVAKKLGASYIVAVNAVGSVSNEIFFEKSDEIRNPNYGIIKSGLEALFALQRSQIQHTISSYKPNVLINVNTDDINPLEFNINIDELIERGYRSAKEVLR